MLTEAEVGRKRTLNSFLVGALVAIGLGNVFMDTLRPLARSGVLGMLATFAAAGLVFIGTAVLYSLAAESLSRRKFNARR